MPLPMPPSLPHFLTTRPSLRLTLLSLSIPSYLIARTTMSSSSTTSPTHPQPSPPTTNQPPFPTRPYIPKHTTFPYHPHDFHRADSSTDADFYSTPRLVTHIDDNAIRLLREYYAGTLPRQGRVLDLCSSWVSHFPREVEERAISQRKKEEGDGNGKTDERGKGLEVVGLGMNAAELAANPILRSYILQDLNTNPVLPTSLSPLTTTVCVVSIDYLTQPLDVLSSLHSLTKPGGTVHLVVSNRCFPTKAVGRWLRVSEEERLQMVGDYLHFSGWEGVEVVELSDGQGKGAGLMGLLGGGVDPLWVVRGVKGVEGGEEKGDGKSEL
ncbi:hypothetical protein ACLMJK_001386 [Lecanora helva]